VLERIRIGNGHAAAVNDGKMGRAFPFAGQRQVLAERLARRGALAIDLARQLGGASFAREVLGDRGKGRIAQVPRPIEVRSPHRFDHEMGRLVGTGAVAMPRAERLQVQVLQDVEHLDEAGAAGAGGRRCEDVVTAVRAVDRPPRLSLISPQVFGRDQPAAPAHFGDDLVGDLPGIKCL